MRTVSPEAIDLVKHFEGCQLESYEDEVGVWTVGWGHTADEGTPLPGYKVTITQAEADAALAKDLQRHAGVVEKLLDEDVNDNMFGALVSFAFNVGDDNLRRSTLLNRVNTRRFQDALVEFPKWDHAGGRVLRGLLRRRLSEANLFCSFPDPVVAHVDLVKYRKPRHYNLADLVLPELEAAAAAPRRKYARTR